MSLYLERYAWQEIVIDPSSAGNPDIIIVIPAFNEPELEKAIESLQICHSPQGEMLILVIINEGENVSEDIHRVNNLNHQLLTERNFHFKTKSCFLRLPDKKAGVGLARKIGMDTAVRIFTHNHKSGIIICFDADCVCENNLLTEVEKQFNQTDCNTALTFYEHPLNGENPEAILNYELYLRYYVDALRWVGFPYAFQTLGSCISVRSDAYEKQGGMNTRKAGEDFYFINKMTAVGKIYEINTTTIYPSDRLSDRVPFGTGHAIDQYLTKGDPEYPVYSPKIFEDLKALFDQLPYIYQTGELLKTTPDSIQSFLKDQLFKDRLKEIFNHSSDYPSFRKRFFHWMDGLKVLKLVHHCRDKYYPNVPLMEAINWLETQYLKPKSKYKNKKEALLKIRKADRQHLFQIK
ncbi:MAG: glycosyltransferase [Bacteroidota bacterium]